MITLMYRSPLLKRVCVCVLGVKNQPIDMMLKPDNMGKIRCFIDLFIFGIK